MRNSIALLFAFALLAPTASHAEPACLLCDMPSGWQEGQAAFVSRVQTAFPPGAKVDDLTQTLKAQKFRDDYWRSRRMVFRYDRIGLKVSACSIVATVDWQDDGAGHLVSTDAHFIRGPGCDPFDQIKAP